METRYLTVKATPDALIKVYDTTADQIIFLDNADEQGKTPPVAIPPAGDVFIDVTPFN